MTYAEKLAINVLETIAPDSTQLGTYTNIEYVAEKINQAMQAQREACASSVRNELVAYEEYVIQAILNAEVQP
jgi:hypothetical protein